MTLSVDHRISDGVEAAQFMQALATLLENPWRLVL
jgi:pyruvate/2-oxoglutarate dehydrogenase complex dihydrolipoamide acyltransferase (E2) component